MLHEFFQIFKKISSKGIYLFFVYFHAKIPFSKETGNSIRIQEYTFYIFLENLFRQNWDDLTAEYQTFLARD